MYTTRKRWWSRVSLVAVLVLAGTAVTQAQEALGPAKNLDFEAGRAAKDLPEGWDVGGRGEGYELALDTKVAQEGKQSGRVAFVGPAEPSGNGFGTLTQCIAPDPFRGQRVRYSGFVRTAKVEGAGVGLWMRVDGPQEGKTLAFDNMLDRSIVGSTDWKKYEIVLDVPKEATAICFGMLVAGKGTAWVDALKFETVAADTPVTDATKATTPKNTDFEAATQGGKFPRGWGGGGDGYEFTIDEKAAHGGKQSGRIRAAGEAGAKPDFGTLTQAVVADAFRGGRVRLTGFVRTDISDAEAWAGLWMRVDGPEKGRSLAFDNMETSKRAIKGQTDWREYVITLDVPKEATYVYFGMLLAGKGTAWVDDLKLEKAPAK
jgi:hypothetical protein